MWCVVANVRATTPFGPQSADRRRGHKHFAPNTKVYCYTPIWDPGMGKVRVYGLHRGSRRFVSITIDTKYLTNWRSKVVYTPTVIAAFQQDGQYWTEAGANDFVHWRSTENNARHEGA